jgi:hypothetical protein
MRLKIKFDQKNCLDAMNRVSLFFIQTAILLYQKLLEFITRRTTIDSNNTPPASREIRAPRGVTHFRGSENPLLVFSNYPSIHHLHGSSLPITSKFLQISEAELENIMAWPKASVS